MVKILGMTDDFVKDCGLDHQNGLHVRLLVEETVGMLAAMVGSFKAKLWIEGDSEGCSIKLNASTDMDIDKKQELLSMSTSGKNASVKGFMSKIGDMIQNSILNMDNTAALQTMYGGSMLDYGYNTGNSNFNVNAEDYVWTLAEYKERLSSGQLKPDEACDLEKSIVASLADNVIVGVKKDKVTLEIVKTFNK